jgi:hypothetical protein
MDQPCKAAMAARVDLGHLLDDFEDSRRPSSLSPRFRRVPVHGWIDRSHLLGRPRGCIYALGEPWGVLHLVLHEIFLEIEGNLVSIISASSRLSCFVALPCRRHISHVRTPNNANWVSWLYDTNFSPILVLLKDKTHIHLRSASIRTYTFFTTGFSRFLSIRGGRGLLALNQVLI